MRNNWFRIVLTGSIFFILLVTLATAQCPTGCGCLNESYAKSLGYTYCGGKQIICGYEQTIKAQIPKYCFQIPATTSEIVSCPSGCICLSQGDAKLKGYSSCAKETRPCGYDQLQNLMYCYSAPPTTTVTPKGTPDLIILDVYTDSWGSFREVRYMIQNRGDGPGGASTTSLFRDGVKIGEDVASGLDPGEFRVEFFAYSGTCSGSSDIFSATADTYNAVAESNETNNAYQREYSCPAVAGMPDLALQEIEHVGEEELTFATREYSSDHPISFRVVNKGSISSPATDARLYIDGTWVATKSVPIIASAAEFTSGFTYTGACSGSSDTIRVMVDPSDRIIEETEVNNEREEIWNCTVPLRPGKMPDLVIRRVWLVPLPDHAYRIGYEIRNQGSGYAPFTDTGLYIDGSYRIADGVDRLAPGEGRDEEFWWNYSMRDCTPPTDTLGIRADYLNTTAESSETNNEETLTFNCTEIPVPTQPKADLVIVSVWYECEPPCRDLIVKYTIRNQGAVAAAASRTNLNINYRDIGNSSAPALGAGEAATLAFPGTWVPSSRENRIQVCADRGNAVDEITPPPSGELNNCHETNWTFEGACDNLVLDAFEQGIDCGGLFCPLCVHCDWCTGSVTPLRIRGTPDDKIDVIIVPDDSYAGNATGFIEDLRLAILNGYYASSPIYLNRDKLNIYYMTSLANVTAYPECGFSPPEGGCSGFKSATTFADSIAVIHSDDFRDWAGTKCDRRVFTSEPTSYRTFVHESGHSLFGLKDEYCCDSSYSQNNPNPNIFSSESACRSDAPTLGRSPDDCVEFCPDGSGNCGDGYWKSEPETCVMRCSQACGNNCCLGCGGAAAMCPFEASCLRRVNSIFGRYP